VKKLISIAIAFAFVTTFVGYAAAAGTGTKPAEKPAATTDKPAEKSADKMEKKADKKPMAKNANGTVKSASADSIVVAGKEKGKEMEWTFAVDSKTKIKKAGKDAMAADLKAGDSVHVRYMEQDGKATAQAVTVKGAGKEMSKKAENPCAAKPAAKTSEPAKTETKKQ